jgi:acyl-coenzyme A synthetase/AMP-(fatty) acid ligase
VNFLPLSQLLQRGRATDHPLALVADAPVEFGRFAADVACVATRLQTSGSRRAALVCRDGYRFAVGLFGLLHAAVTVVLPPNGQRGTLNGLADAFDTLVDDGLLDGLAADDTKPPPIDPGQAKLEFFTSGTTGTAKRIGKSLVALEREVATLDRIWGEEIGQATTIATVSHQHLYGLTFKLLWPLAAGRPFISETHEIWESLLDRLPIASLIVSSPAHLGRLSGIAALPASLWPRAIFSAGAPLLFADALETESIFGVRPTEIFGTTETGVIAARRRASEEQPWLALPGVNVASDDHGRLKVRSPFADTDVWVKTGDLIEAVGVGFQLRGRADRIVKIEGKRVSLTEIELALCRLPWTAKAIALVLPGDPARLAAVVVPSAAGRAKLAELGRFRFGRLLRHALTETQEPAGLPRLWRFGDELPRDHMGKPPTAALLALFGVAP